MKKLINILFVAILLFAAKAEAQNMRTIFLEMPDSILPLLTSTNRADCTDFIEAGMKARVTNRFDGHSELLELTTDYLKMKMTSHTELQMKLLPISNGDTIICMINTVCAEACDSHIRFFTKGWKELTPQKKYFTSPTIKDFFTANTSINKKLMIADMYLVELTLSASSTDMIAKYTMPGYMSQEDSLFVSKDMHDIKYIWNGKKFINNTQK